MYPLFPYEPEEAVIEPRQIVRPAENFPKCCLAVFSVPIFEKIRTRPEAEKIASVSNANGEVPVYRILHGGTPIAAYMTPIGAPACVGTMEEVMALGADRAVLFGSCGVLDKTIPDGAVILPRRAYRDEGTSFHYAPPSEYMEADADLLRMAREVFDAHSVPVKAGAVWTTDAFYRETPRRMRFFRKKGCLAVEMECAALFAMAQYRGYRFMPFLYGADNLDGESGWDARSLCEQGVSRAEVYLACALELCVRL